MSACGADPSDVPTATSAADVMATIAPSSSLASSVTFPANGEKVTVQVTDNYFRPAELTIVAGTEVHFENRGRNNHNVLPVDDLSGQSWGVLTEDFAPGASYDHVFNAAGTFPIVCTIHGVNGKGMVGTITVTAP